MKVYLLGRLNRMLSTTLFHAMAELGHEALILCEPEDTYISLGYFDKAEELIDLKKCRELGVGVIRRRTGGGAVLLGPGQVFYQLLLSKNRVPFRVEEAYRKLSQPVIRAYARLGVEVEYRPINDLVVKVNHRKISGQGAGDIGRLFVFVGNILMSFDPELMSELFALNSEELREEVRKSLWENISWLEREVGKDFSFEKVSEVLLEEFSRDWELEICESLPEGALELAEVLRGHMTCPDCILEDTGRRHHTIKIREGVYVRRV
ncbi:MAG: lipoate--protein ligase family protein [Aquificaceae bacterium]|nr:lipoate--protein ligase family protein [Aquificaceae bacterium]MCX7990282.1 lipoate--protein ligase family protein [Aquificaceae bacterium]MDW8032718.1 lipoate--protein ligase family protein [Aquificaceae bacterium]